MKNTLGFLVVVVATVVGFLAGSRQVEHPTIEIPDNTAAIAALRKNLEEQLELLEAQGATLATVLSELARRRREPPVSTAVVEPPREDAPAADDGEVDRKRFAAFVASIYSGAKDLPMNRALQSEDEFLRAYALRVSSIEARPALLRAPVDAFGIEMAKKLAGAGIDEAEMAELASIYETSKFPRNFNACVALELGGDDSYLDDWSIGALDYVQTDEPNIRGVKTILHACTLYDNPLDEEIGLAASSSKDSKVRLMSIKLLGKIDTPESIAALKELADDENLAVSTRAKVHLLEIGKSEE